MNKITTKDAALRCACTVRAYWFRAESAGIKPEMIAGRAVWSPGQVARLAIAPARGRPKRKIKENHHTGVDIAS